MNQREHEQEEKYVLHSRQCEQKVNSKKKKPKTKTNKQKKLLKEMCHFLSFKYVYFDTRKLITVVILSDFF